MTLAPAPAPLLADAAHRWSFATKQLGTTLSKETLAVQSRYRARLRQAQRFVLDDQAVRLVCHLSHEFQRLEGWSFLARLPYDCIWIELNLHEKLREFDRMGTLKRRFDRAQVAPRLGLLLYLDGDGCRWVCHEFYDHGNRSVDLPSISPGMLSHVFDPEGGDIAPVRGSRCWNAPTLSLLPGGFPRWPVEVRSQDGTVVRGEADCEYLLCGLLAANHSIAAAQNPDGSFTALESPITVPQWFLARAATIVDPWWRAYFAPRLNRSDDERQHAYRLISGQAGELQGQLRWIVTLLAAINGLPRAVKPIATRPGRRPVGMHQLPYFQHSSLTITLPRDDRVVWARQHLDRSAGNALARRPWHPVRGHWRVVERGKPVLYLCRHLPTMVENGLGICERCEMMIRWIAAHERGDPNIGMVSHTYNVHAKRQTPPVELGLTKPTPNDA